MRIMMWAIVILSFAFHRCYVESEGGVQGMRKDYCVSTSVMTEGLGRVEVEACVMAEGLRRVESYASFIS